MATLDLYDITKCSGIAAATYKKRHEVYTGWPNKK